MVLTLTSSGQTSWYKDKKGNLPSDEDQWCPESEIYVVLWLTAALWSNTWGVMGHFQTNNPFSYRLGSDSAKVKAPVWHRGCWKHTTAPLFWEFLLEWTRFGLRLLFSFSCCSWGSFPPLFLLLPIFHRPYTGRWFCEWNHAYPHSLYDGNDWQWRNNGGRMLGFRGYGCGK